MVELYPFCAYRYNAKAIGNGDLKAVVVNPSIALTKKRFDMLVNRSTFNAIKLIAFEYEVLSERDALGEKSKDLMKEWIEKGVLERDVEQGFYLYEIEYGEPPNRRHIRGLIGLMKLHEYGDGRVVPHEYTTDGIKARMVRSMELLKSNLSLIFCLYEDASNEVQALERMLTKIAQNKPLTSVTCDLGFVHKLWHISDEACCNLIRKALKDKRVFLGDGHHRYEAALEYYRKHGKPDKIMAFLVNIHTQDLEIQPFHRVIRNIPAFDFEKFLEKLRVFFHVEEKHISVTEIQQFLEGLGRTSFVIKHGESCFLCTPKHKAFKAAGQHPSQLAVGMVQELIVKRMLRLSVEQIKSNKYLHYIQEVEEAFSATETPNTNFVVLLGPADKNVIMDMIVSGYQMPEKSTCFCPKPLIGLTFHRFE